MKPIDDKEILKMMLIGLHQNTRYEQHHGIMEALIDDDEGIFSTLVEHITNTILSLPLQVYKSRIAELDLNEVPFTVTYYNNTESLLSDIIFDTGKYKGLAIADIRIDPSIYNLYNGTYAISKDELLTKINRCWNIRGKLFKNEAVNA